MDAKDLAAVVKRDGFEQAYLTVLLRDSHHRARVVYCRTVTNKLRDLSALIGSDSFLEAEDARDMSAPGEKHPNNGNQEDSRRAIVAVCQMAAELAAGAVSLLESSLKYAAAGVIRQLLECEYLLAAFREDLGASTKWNRATPKDIRTQFQPTRMRKVGGFDNTEYWTHCDIGGHPNPKGVYLLAAEKPFSSISTPGFNARPDRSKIAENEIWLDLAFHIRRIWNAELNLLREHHARFEADHSNAVSDIAEVEIRWRNEDLMATGGIAGPLLAFVKDKGDSA